MEDRSWWVVCQTLQWRIRGLYGSSVGHDALPEDQLLREVERPPPVSGVGQWKPAKAAPTREQATMRKTTPNALQSAGCQSRSRLPRIQGCDVQRGLEFRHIRVLQSRTKNMTPVFVFFEHPPGKKL